MILDKGPRALICAFSVLPPRSRRVPGGFGLPRLRGPAGDERRQIWWVDPVNGRAPAAGGLGTQAAPWGQPQRRYKR